MATLKENYERAKDVYKNTIEFCAPFFPTPKKEREEFMNLVRERVSHFKTKIEKRSGVDLGEIKVKDCKEFIPDSIYSFAPINGARNAWKKGRIPTSRDFYDSFLDVSVMEPISKMQFWAYMTKEGAELAHYNGSIYVPFYYPNRVGDTDFKERINNLDYAVIHELGHALWNKLEEETDEVKNKHSNLRKIWYEGFATYCAEDLFSDFLMNPGRVYRLSEIYIRGRSKIKEAVDKHGYEILFKIPNRWKEFS